MVPEQQNGTTSPEATLPSPLVLPARDLLKGIGREHALAVFPIRQEASQRRYYRLHDADRKEPSLILCHDPALPELGHQADFLIVQKHLAGAGIAVPRVLAVDTSHGLLLLSDAGRRDLYDILEAEPDSLILNEAIEMLVRLHRLAPELPVKGRAFDPEKLRSEIVHLENALHVLEKKNSLTPLLSPEIRFFLRGLCDLLGQSTPLVFTHRDFHARNLLVADDGSLTMVDFQDARLGLPWYDLSSLLFDPYANHSGATIEAGFERYCSAVGLSAGPNRNLFLAQALQRLFKALGSYVHLTFIENLAHIYARSIGPALERIELAAQMGGFPDSVFLFVGDARRRLLPLLPSAKGAPVDRAQAGL